MQVEFWLDSVLQEVIRLVFTKNESFPPAAIGHPFGASRKPGASKTPSARITIRPLQSNP